MLTPEQREKEQVEHERMMMRMEGGMMGRMGEGMMGGGMMGGGMMGGGGHDAPVPGQPRMSEEKQDEHRH